MNTKPAQQPEVIKPTAPPQVEPKSDSKSTMPPLKNSGTSTPPPISGSGTIPPPNTGDPTPPPPGTKPALPFDKLKDLPKNIKLAIGIGMGILILMILSVIGGAIVNVTKPVIQPTPTPPFVNKPTPTPEPTSTWRTYSSEKYGFEIKYPHEFNLSKSLEDQRFEYSEGVDIKNFNRVTRFVNPNSTWMQIETLYTVEDIQDVTEWLKKDYPTSNRSGTSSGTLRNILPAVAAGQEIVIFEDGINETRKNVVFYKDRRMIIITLFPIAETGGSYTDIKESGNYLNQMLSTFRFTDISFVPINQNVLFDTLEGWKVTEETRDRIYIANSNKTKIIKFYKKKNVSRTDVENEVKKKMISDIKNSSTNIGGQYAGEISGCQKTGSCNRLYSLVLTSGNITYLIQYENNNSDPEFNAILKKITIK